MKTKARYVYDVLARDETDKLGRLMEAILDLYDEGLSDVKVSELYDVFIGKDR